jgi:hypothetical protein
VTRTGLPRVNKTNSLSGKTLSCSEVFETCMTNQNFASTQELRTFGWMFK